MRKKNIIELTRVSIEEYREMRKLPLLLMADNVRSAQNIGAMMRTADAFLLEEMILAGISATPPYAEISKTALGAEDSVSWRYVVDALEEVKRFKEKGVKVFVLEQTHGSIPLQQLSAFLKDETAINAIGNTQEYGKSAYKALKVENIDTKELKKCLLVVGNEVNGVNQKIVDLADAALEIPMHGIKHSLNVSVSAGIALWEFYRIYEDTLASS